MRDDIAAAAKGMIERLRDVDIAVVRSDAADTIDALLSEVTRLTAQREKWMERAMDQLGENLDARAVITASLSADSGYQCSEKHRISADQWGQIVGVMNGADICAEAITSERFRMIELIKFFPRGADGPADAMERESWVLESLIAQILGGARHDYQ